MLFLCEISFESVGTAVPKIVIADSAEGFREELGQLLGAAHQIYLTADGAAALELVKENQPELLVADISLPMLDGISLLEQLHEEGYCPAVLVTGRIFSDYAIDTLTRLKVGYLLRKPCSVEMAARRASELLQYHGSEDRKNRSSVSAMLSLFGVPVRVSGYKYIVEAFCLMKKDPSLYMTKEIYPAVANRFKSDGERVERCIRHAVKLGVQNGNQDLWRMHFGEDKNGNPARPANGKFLALLLELDQNRQD